MSKDQEKIQIEIGKRIKELRLKSNDPDKDNFTAWADKHHIERKQLWKLENGKNDFKLSSLIKVLEIYNIGFEDFFKGL